MSISLTSTLKKFTGVVSHFYDTEDNYLAIDPMTIPGVLYCYRANTGKDMLKIGNGDRWSTIEPIGGDGVPIGTIIYHFSRNPLDGYLLLDGTTISRDTYRELYNFAVDSGMIVTDEQWNSSKSFKGFFSYGDGPNNFRLPCLDDIILESWISNKDRAPGGYKPGTIIGTDYANGNYTATPYMSYLAYGVLLKDSLTTELNPTRPNNYTGNNKEDYIETSEWLTENRIRPLLTHPTPDKIRETIGLDHVDEEYTPKMESMQISQIVEGDDTTHISVLGMSRPETVAYPIFIKYRSR